MVVLAPKGVKVNLGGKARAVVKARKVTWVSKARKARQVPMRDRTFITRTKTRAQLAQVQSGSDPSRKPIWANKEFA